jgi:hypothetical protein
MKLLKLPDAMDRSIVDGILFLFQVISEQKMELFLHERAGDRALEARGNPAMSTSSVVFFLLPEGMSCDYLRRNRR